MCVRALKTGKYAEIEVSASYAFATVTGQAHPDQQMTVLLALVALHLLASSKDHWSILPTVEKNWHRRKYPEKV